MSKYKDKETQRAEKYMKVSELSDDMAKWITRNEEEWKKYLTCAARIYKYPFHEQLLIYAQKPDATAVASVKIWNERMFCWVNKGAKGIALLDHDYPDENRLKYVFDVADVHKAKRIGRDPNLWTMREEYKDAVITRLENTYGRTQEGAPFGDRLVELAGMIAEDYYEDVVPQLMYAREGTYLAELDEQNLALRVKETLCSSIAFTLLSRIGEDIEKYQSELDFSYIHEFNSNAAIMIMGAAVSDMAKPVLQEIGREIRAIEKGQNKRRTNIRKSIANDSNINYNALKRESETAQGNKLEERGQEDGKLNLHTERGLHDSELSSGRSTGGQGDTIRADEEEIPSGAHERDLSALPPIGYVKITPPYNPGTGRTENGRTDETDGKSTERDRGAESDRPDGMGTPDEQHQTVSGGNRSERNHLHVVEPPKEVVGYEQLSLFPTETEQKSTIKAMEAGMANDQSVAFSLSKNQINDILLTGSGHDQSRKKIFFQYQHGRDSEFMTDFLKNEYGKVGKGFIMDGHPISVWFDESGMHGIRSIGINIHEKGKDAYEDDQIDLLVGNSINMYLVSYIPYIKDIDKAVDMMAELMYQMPEMEIDGIIPIEVAARYDEIKEERMDPVEKLARDIDIFSKEYDPYEYDDNVGDFMEHQNSIRESIEIGDTGYLKEWLEKIVVKDDYKDNRRHAHQLLQRLEHVAKHQEYKPLAKVEELEEGNYNKIDGLIDTSEKNNKVEYEKKAKGISIKNKLAEKKAEIERKMKKKECEPSKK